MQFELTRVLVLEDNPGDLVLIEESLRRSHYGEFTLDSANSLAEAENKLADNRYDVVLADLNLPDSQGLSTLQSIRDCCYPTPIVVITGNDDEKLPFAALDRGAEDYLQKSQLEPAYLTRTLYYAAARARAEIAHQKSEQRFSLIAEQVPAAIFELDTDLGLVNVNRATLSLFGFTDVEAMRSAINNENLISGPAGFQSLLKRLKRDGELHNTAFRFANNHGNILHAVINGGAMTNPRGQIVGYQGTITDVTAMRQLEDALTEARKLEAVGKLAGGVAHDFNNLLTVIIGNIYLARQSISRDSGAAESIDLAYDAATQAASLTRNLVAFSRRQILKPEHLDLRVLVDNVMPLFKRTMNEKIRVDFRRPESPVWVFADAGQLENALLALAMNANEAMPDGGLVSIELAHADRQRAYPSTDTISYASLVIRDNGTGIDPLIADEVFEPFVTTKQSGSGHGLGLSMVQGFVQQTGGDIIVSSVEGSGTEFLLRLPLANIDSTDTVIHLERQAEPALVVEKFGEGCRQLTQLVASIGYDVSSVSNLEETASAIDANDKIRLLVVDINTLNNYTQDTINRSLNTFLRHGVKALFVESTSMPTPAIITTHTAATLLPATISQDSIKQYIDKSLGDGFDEVTDADPPAIESATR